MSSKEKTKSLINKATSDDRNPPSGYLLKELSTRTMSIAECQTIEDLVVRKLAKNKPYIKYKALRIVKFLCENGSPNWRRAWQRNTDKLRDAQQFRGPPDPIYGDAPYQQVRKAAKDAMQAVFQQATIDSSHIKNRIKGLDGGGSNTYVTTSVFGSGSRGVIGGSAFSKKDKAPSGSWGKQMPGHGNTSYQPQVRTTTFEPLKSGQSYINPAVFSGTNTHSKGKLDTRRSGGKRRKGGVGGVWGGHNEEEEEEDEEDYSNQYEDEFPSSDHYEKPKKKLGFGGNIKRKSKASSGQYERRWLDDIVKSGGVGCKIVDLPKYVQQFENLSKNHVLEYLDEKLEGNGWQKQGKAVTLIEALIKGKSSDDVIDYFSQSPEGLRGLQNSKKSIIRRKANAVIEYLDLSDNEEEEVEETEEEEEEEEQEQEQQQPIQRARPQKQKQKQDLLNIGGNEEEDGDMFADMNTISQHKAKEVDLMGFANMDKRPQQKQSTNANDIMGIMNVQATTETQTKDNKRPKENYAFLDIVANDINVAQNDDGQDILGMGFAEKQSGNTQSNATSAFGFDLGADVQPPQQPQQPPPQQQQQPQQKQSGGSSAFGFDLGGSTKQSQTQSNVEQTVGGSSAFGFDLGANTTANNNMTQSQQSMNMMGNMMNPMMTPQMLQQNQHNRQFLQSNVGQMNNMQNMMQQMQAMQMNQNMMNMMNQNMGHMIPPQQPNLFNQAMANVSNVPPQQQRPQTYVTHNDPFAQMMSGGSQQQAPQRPKKRGPDPFAEFGLKSIK